MIKVVLKSLLIFLISILFFEPPNSLGSTPTIYRFELYDAIPSPHQTYDQLKNYTNDRLIKIEIDVSKDAKWVFFTEDLTRWDNPIELNGIFYYYSLSPGDRLAKVFCKVADLNWNESAIAEAGIILDTKPPVPGKIIFGNGNPYHNKPEIKICWQDFYDENGLMGYYLHSDKLKLFDGWTEQTCQIFIKLIDGSYDLSVSAQDSAGNLSSEVNGTFCIDTLPPMSFPAKVRVAKGAGCSNKEPILVEWTGFYDETNCEHSDGISSYVIQYFLNEASYPPDPINNPPFTQNSYLFWKNPPEGRLKVAVRAIDRAGNISASAFGTTTFDKTSPKISLLGFMNSQIDEEKGGFINIAAFCPFSDADIIYLFYLDSSGNIFPTGISLNDKGRFGDANPGDGIYTFYFPVAPGNPSGVFPIIGIAVDRCQNISYPWPFLWVNP